MNAITFTREAQERLKAYLGRSGYRIPVGLGNEEAACSIAAINIAISGQLTARIPDCMSRVIAKWIITTQDVMPDELRNSERWKAALVLAAGTGRALERERSDIVVDCMWKPFSRPAKRSQTTTDSAKNGAGCATNARPKPATPRPVRQQKK